MEYAKLATWFMLVFTGLWAGGILIFAVERTNLWRRMSIEQYTVDFRRSVLRVDPMMPIFNIIALAATIAFALNHAGAAQWWGWIAVAAMVVVIVSSVTLAEPVNSKFRRLPEGEAPDRVEYYRVFWRRFHLFRTVTALIGLASVAAATAAAAL